MAISKDTRQQPNRPVKGGAKESAGHLRDDVTFDNSAKTGQSRSVRLPRDVGNQNRKGLGKPW